MVKEQVAEFPVASVAVAVTVVTPTGNAAPLAWDVTKVAPQLSAKLTVNVTVC
jgi:hypothetical protein